MEVFIIGTFAAGLAVCIGTGLSVIYALVFGLMIFCLYAGRKGFSAAEIIRMLIKGIGKIRNILVIFVLIGCLTGIWRVCGTIPYIVYHAVNLIVPQYFVLCSFLLCSLISYLTGTSFGTVSTMGVICMTLGRAAGVAELPLGGAILSGCFFGDRCSPMSSSALLVADLTKTDIFENVKTMFHTAMVPLVATCVIYFLQGSGKAAPAAGRSVDILAEAFHLTWPVLIPAVLTLALSLCRVDVKITMGLSILSGILLCLTVQNMSVSEVFGVLLAGFHPEHDPELQTILGGGGISSMVNVSIIVCISSSFSGIFEQTGLLEQMSARVERLAGRITDYGAFLLTAVLASMISCNQTLAAILTNQMTAHMVPKAQTRASWLEDTVIVIAPLIPWSIAGAVPLAAIGVSGTGLVFACYLYLIPLWNLFLRLVISTDSRRKGFSGLTKKRI